MHVTQKEKYSRYRKVPYNMLGSVLSFHCIVKNAYLMFWNSISNVIILYYSSSSIMFHQ